MTFISSFRCAAPFDRMVGE